MVRTQIQLPDRLHSRLKQFAAQEETSLAEIVRRAGEYFLAVYPAVAEAEEPWSLPVARDLGRVLAPESDWRVLANEQSVAETSEERGR